MRLLVLALLALGACDKPVAPDRCEDDTEDTEVVDTGVTDTDTDEPDEPAPLVGMHDGTYTVAFQRGGSHFAVGKVVVAYSQITGEVRSGDGLQVSLSGHATEDGTLVLDSLTNTGGFTIALVEGHVRDGVLEGTYTLDGDEGYFAGSKNGDLQGQDPTTEWDGTWEIATLRDGDETSAFVIDVKKGRFATTMVDNAQQSYDLDGYITSDGTIILNNATSAVGLIIAAASIDQDTYDIEGVYRAGDLVGKITGRRGD